MLRIEENSSHRAAASADPSRYTNSKSAGSGMSSAGRSTTSWAPAPLAPRNPTDAMATEIPQTAQIARAFRCIAVTPPVGFRSRLDRIHLPSRRNMRSRKASTTRSAGVRQPCRRTCPRAIHRPFGWPSRKGSLVRERPLEGRDEGVNPHSSLSRTKPSGRGVAPDPARTARSATGGRTVEPQGVAFLADEWQGPCESREIQSVNRPPASISRSSTA